MDTGRPEPLLGRSFANCWLLLRVPDRPFPIAGHILPRCLTDCISTGPRPRDAGDFFLVSVVITGEEHDRIRREAERIEQATGRGILKWHKTAFESRLAYLQELIRHPLFAGTASFSHYRDTTLYTDLTVLVTAKAILQKARGDYKATIIVDGLRRGQVKRFGSGLRQLGIHVRKVRGIRDESDALIRLADSIAGFVRDAIEGEAYAQLLYQEATTRGVIREIK